MSRSNFPPAYDDPNMPLYSHGRNYPPPPAYGFPAHGGSQPNAPYPPGPNASVYPGQLGGYPPGPYPGQPGGYPPGPYPGQPGGYPPGTYQGQPGGYPPGPYLGQPGYGPDMGQPQAGGPPRLPPMPPRIPPTIPPDALESGDGFAASDWDSVSIRHAFIRKVYMILAVQLLVTTGIVAVFTFVDSVKQFVQKNQAVYWASYAVYFITHIVLVCCTGPRRKHPWNLLLLLLFTLALSYMTGTISSFYSTQAVFLALGITAVVCISVTIFCFQTKVDFTKCQGLFCVLGIVMFVTGIITVIVLSFKYMYWLHMLYAGIGAVVFTMFLAYHTQLLIGNRKYSIGPEEYVFAALSIYVDVIQTFLFLLQIIVIPA